MNNVKEIFNFICNLRTCQDDEVFQKTNLEELGEFLYSKIISKFPTAKKELIKALVRARPEERLLTDSALYLAICSRAYIQKLPKVAYDSIKAGVVAMATAYIALVKQLDAEIKALNTSLLANKEQVKRLRHAGVTRRFSADITEIEKQIADCEHTCNRDRTRKEILLFLKAYLEHYMSSLCDLKDADSIDEKCKEFAMKACTSYSKEEDYSFCYAPYNDILKAVTDDLNRPEALFFKAKYIFIFNNAFAIYQRHAGLDEAKVKEANRKAQAYLDSFPSIDELISIRNTNRIEYCARLKKIVGQEAVVSKLESNIDSCIGLHRRKKVLKKCIKLYQDGEFELFSNTVPIQIEGIFNDFLKDVTTFSRFSEVNLNSNKVLKEKVALIWEYEKGIPLEAIAYFMFYFNNLIRNTTAHGNGANIGEDETTAYELLLDLHSIIYLVTRYGELERMYRFVESHISKQNPITKKMDEDFHFGSLYSSLIGEQITLEYDYITKFNPIQIAYWLINPYYENLYASVAPVEDLKALRETLLSSRFWNYAYEQLERFETNSFPYVKREFLSVINGLFSCKISEEMKKELIKVRQLVVEKIRLN